MCRFVAYRGPPVNLHEFLYEPEHSLIHQSVHSREREEPLNGDGWGVGWYDHERARHPAVYRTTNPAWSDENMRHVSPLVRTPLFLAHVRAATAGLAVQQLNCHPFVGGEHTHEEHSTLSELEESRHNLLFMHNGTLGGHRQIIRRLRFELPEDLYFSIRGSTDSEHAFAVIQDHLGEAAVDATTADLVDAVHSGLAYLESLKDDLGVGEKRTQANFVLTDGETLVATRYASPGDVPAQSLYVGRADGFHCHDGRFSAHEPEGDGATIIASERLFRDDRVWTKVPRNHLVVVDPQGELWMEDLDAA